MISAATNQGSIQSVTCSHWLLHVCRKFSVKILHQGATDPVGDRRIQGDLRGPVTADR